MCIKTCLNLHALGVVSGGAIFRAPTSRFPPACMYLLTARRSATITYQYKQHAASGASVDRDEQNKLGGGSIETYDGRAVCLPAFHSSALGPDACCERSTHVLVLFFSATLTPQIAPTFTRVWRAHGHFSPPHECPRHPYCPPLIPARGLAGLWDTAWSCPFFCRQICSFSFARSFGPTLRDVVAGVELHVRGAACNIRFRDNTTEYIRRLPLTKYPFAPRSLTLLCTSKLLGQGLARLCGERRTAGRVGSLESILLWCICRRYA